MKYRIYYKCMFCSVKFFFDMKEDEVIYGDNGFFSPKDLMGKSNKSQQEFFSKSGHPHKCEEDTMGWGKAVAIRKIPL